MGAHENSVSAYGAFDQAGNVMELSETVPESDIRGIRGGSYQWAVTALGVLDRPLDMLSSDQSSDLGFRVANVGERGEPVRIAAARGLRCGDTGLLRLRRRVRSRLGSPSAVSDTTPALGVTSRRGRYGQTPVPLQELAPSEMPPFTVPAPLPVTLHWR